MTFPSASECIKEFDLDGDGLLSHTELAICLEAVLSRGGCVESKRVAAGILEEWALRSAGVAAGAGEGALDRLLRAAHGHCPRGTKRAREEVGDQEAEGDEAPGAAGAEAAGAQPVGGSKCS